MEVLVSFLLPVRKRPKTLKLSLDSLLNTCSNVSNYEVIVVFDDDDIETINEFDSWDKNYNYKKIISQRFGYDFLNKYYNLASNESSGKWLWVWNDDTEMINKNWDLIIEEYNDQFLILNPFNTREMDAVYLQTHTLFPIIPRKYVELLGHISPWNHIDTYIERICSEYIKNEFRILHTHNKNDDEISKEIVYHRISFPQEQFEIDFRIIRDFIHGSNNK